MNLVNPLGLTIEGQCALLVASVVSLGRLIQEPVYSLAPLNRGLARAELANDRAKLADFEERVASASDWRSAARYSDNVGVTARGWRFRPSRWNARPRRSVNRPYSSKGAVRVRF
jgi:hypothetical protein